MESYEQSLVSDLTDLVGDSLPRAILQSECNRLAKYVHRVTQDRVREAREHSNSSNRIPDVLLTPVIAMRNKVASQRNPDRVNLSRRSASVSSLEQIFKQLNSSRSVPERMSTTSDFQGAALPLLRVQSAQQHKADVSEVSLHATNAITQHDSYDKDISPNGVIPPSEFLGMNTRTQIHSYKGKCSELDTVPASTAMSLSTHDKDTKEVCTSDSGKPFNQHSKLKSKADTHMPTTISAAIHPGIARRVSKETLQMQPTVCLSSDCNHNCHSTEDLVQCSHSDLLQQCHKMLCDVTRQVAALQVQHDKLHKNVALMQQAESFVKANIKLEKQLTKKSAQCDELLQKNAELKAKFNSLILIE